MSRTPSRATPSPRRRLTKPSRPDATSKCSLADTSKVIGKASGPSAHPLCPSAVRLGARHSEDRVTEGHGPKRARVGRGCQLSDAADLDQFGVRVILLHCYSSHGVVFLCAEASQRLGLDGGEEISIDTRPS